MLLDLNDADSILRWWKVWPDRHDANLEYFLQSSPQCAPAITEAQRRIACLRLPPFWLFRHHFRALPPSTVE